MDLFDVFRRTFAWMATVAVLWPVNIPLAGLAYKVRQGHKPIDMEAFWWRSTFATLILAAMTCGFVWLDYFLAGDTDLPSGPVHVVVICGYIGAASWLYFVFFALEDFFQGLGMVAIYFCIPMAVLFLLNLLTGWWNKLLLNYALTWLKQ